MRRTETLSSALLLALALAAGPAGAEEVYRWVDKDGVVHYGDSPPPEYAEQMFEDRFPAPSVEEQETAAQERADRVLLQTYLSVAEIEAVRDQRLEQLQYQDQLTRSYLDNLNRHLQDLEAAAGEGEEAPTPGVEAEDPVALAGEIDETRRKIGIYEEELESSEEEQAEIRAKFADDIERFRQLTAASPEG